MAINTSRAFAHQSATVSNSAKSLTDLTFAAAQIERASRARINCDTQPIRYTYDGTTPTASVGQYLAVGATVDIVGSSNVANLKFIRATGSDGAVNVTLED